MKSKLFIGLIALLFTAIFAGSLYHSSISEGDPVELAYHPTVYDLSISDEQPHAPAEYSTEVVYAQASPNLSVSGFLKENWLALLFGFLGLIEVIIRLTPTEVDNSVFNLLKRLIDAWFPNHKSGGGLY